MAVGTLIVNPESLRGLPSNLAHDARLFVGCFVRENDKHRTHSENGPEPYWKDSLNCEVREGDGHLNIEIVNESPNNGGILATAKVPLDPAFTLGTEQKTIDLTSHDGRPVGQLRLKLSFNGSHTSSSVTTSLGNLNLGGGESASYQQTTSYSQTTSHHVNSESRQSSYSSLGPANPIPENYGAGSPPPFTPPAGAAAAYPEKGNTSMPTAPTNSGNNLMNAEGVVDPRSMSKDEFEEAKARGSLPTWAKYGGGVLAGAAAIGLTAWGAHELKEALEEKYSKPTTVPHIPNQDKLPYKIENLQHQQPAQHPPPQPHQAYQQQPIQQHHSVPAAVPAAVAGVAATAAVHKSSESDKRDKKKDKKEKKEKKDKKEKRSKKDKKDKKKSKKGSGSDSDTSDSSSSDSD